MALRIVIKVVPASGRSMCQIDKSGILKCSLKSPPEKGKANDELIRLIAKKLDISQNEITIILGKTARNKTILINTTKDELAVKSLLCDGLQMSVDLRKDSL